MAADTAAVEVEVVKNATNVVKSVTLPAIVTKAEAMAAAVATVEVEADTVVAAVMEEGTEDEAEEPEARPVTLAAATAICRATVPRARNVTIVSLMINLTESRLINPTGGEVGHLSRDCPSETSSERVCYKCKQPGHVQAACPN